MTQLFQSVTSIIVIFDAASDGNITKIGQKLLKYVIQVRGYNV